MEGSVWTVYGKAVWILYLPLWQGMQVEKCKRQNLRLGIWDELGLGAYWGPEYEDNSKVWEEDILSVWKITYVITNARTEQTMTEVTVMLWSRQGEEEIKVLGNRWDSKNALETGH